MILTQALLSATNMFIHADYVSSTGTDEDGITYKEGAGPIGTLPVVEGPGGFAFDFGMLLMAAVPLAMLLLFSVSVLLSYYYYRKKKKAMAEEALILARQEYAEPV